MPEGRGRFLIPALLMLAFALLVVIVLAEGRAAPSAPTPDVRMLRTEAVATFAAGLTAAAPTSAPSTPDLSAATSPTPETSGTPSCLGLRFVRDVTIPDNTEKPPAEVFTKTWLVENSGTCPWEPGFQVVLIGGIAMGGSPYRLERTVGPGGTIQVAIKMAAPTNQTGVVQGTWKMADGNGVQFGDFLSVVIVVSGPTRMPPAVSATSTDSP